MNLDPNLAGPVVKIPLQQYFEGCYRFEIGKGQTLLKILCSLINFTVSVTTCARKSNCFMESRNLLKACICVRHFQLMFVVF